MSGTNVLVKALTEEHRDGRWWADMDDDLWVRPFYIVSHEACLCESTEAYGPYRLVLDAES